MPFRDGVRVVKSGLYIGGDNSSANNATFT